MSENGAWPNDRHTGNLEGLRLRRAQDVAPVKPSDWAPDRIYLQREQGEGGLHTWCEDSVGDGDLIEEAEYVRVGVQNVARAPEVPQSVIDALRFYAHGHHYNIDENHQQFDTVSGEPVNWLHSERDDDCTMIEDGGIAKAALCGGIQGFEEPTEPIEGEVLLAAPAAPAVAEAKDADEWLIERTTKLLAEIALILNGEPATLTRSSYHDLPDKVRALQCEVELLRENAASAVARAGGNARLPLNLTFEQVSALYLHLLRRQRPEFGWMEAPLVAIEEALKPAHNAIHDRGFNAMNRQFFGDNRMRLGEAAMPELIAPAQPEQPDPIIAAKDVLLAAIQAGGPKAHFAAGEVFGLADLARKLGMHPHGWMLDALKAERKGDGGVSALVDEAFRTLQHDTGEHNVEYVFLRKQLASSFKRIVREQNRRWRGCEQPSARVALSAEIGADLHDWPREGHECDYGLRGDGECKECTALAELERVRARIEKAVVNHCTGEDLWIATVLDARAILAASSAQTGESKC